MPKTAKLFMNGRSQAVRLPLEFRFPGTEVQIERDPATGNVLLSPVPAKPAMSWNDFFAMARANPAEEEFLADRRDELPPPPVSFE